MYFIRRAMSQNRYYSIKRFTYLQKQHNESILHTSESSTNAEEWSHLPDPTSLEAKEEIDPTDLVVSVSYEWTFHQRFLTIRKNNGNCIFFAILVVDYIDVSPGPLSSYQREAFLKQVGGNNYKVVDTCRIESIITRKSPSKIG
jgi:hypothetical protein